MPTVFPNRISTTTTIIIITFSAVYVHYMLSTSIEGEIPNNSDYINKFPFEISPSYNYELSTEANYATTDEQYVGKYIRHRQQLDYAYHQRYTPARQLLQDLIMDTYQTVEIDDGEFVCEVPEENWLVFTAGPMGAGKSHVLRALHDQGIFPLKAFVCVDPDDVRMKLPEFAEYNSRDPMMSGRRTQREVGLISEILTLNALEEGKNALVDGSLRDTEWYDSYISRLKSLFPLVKIAIIEITASEDNVFTRARRRADTTGRFVPDEILRDTIASIPRSVEVLKRHADFIATFKNDESIELVKSTSGLLSKNEFRDIWKMTCRPNQPMIKRESSRSKRSVSDLISTDYDGSNLSNGGDNFDLDGSSNGQSNFLGISEMFGDQDSRKKTSFCKNVD